TRSADTRSDTKSAESPADADQRRHAAAPREKEKIRVILPSPIAVNPSPVNSSAAPVTAATPAAPVETTAAPEERRDANDLARPPYAEASDPNRPPPPAEIPVSRPLDLRAEVAEPSVRERATAAAEDALSTAKSLFHAVLPK